MATSDLFQVAEKPGAGRKKAVGSPSERWREEYTKLAGIRDRGPKALKKAIEAGISYSAAEALGEELSLGPDRLAAMLRLSSRTLQRRKEKGRLDPIASDRAIRLVRIYCLVLELFDGDRDAARAWIKRPNPALEGLPPEELIATETGASLVESLVGRLEQGVFS